MKLNNKTDKKYILAIDTATHKTGLVLIDEDNKIVEHKQIIFNYETTHFDEFEFLRFMKCELKFLKKYNIEKIIMEKQFITTYTLENSILTLREGHEKIKSILEFMFETKVCEVEAQPWKVCCVKELKLVDYCDYKDKNAWVNLFNQIEPDIELTQDEVDAYFMARFLNHFNQIIKERKTSIIIKTKNWTLIISYDAKRDCVWDIQKINNNTVQTKQLEDLKPRNN